MPEHDGHLVHFRCYILWGITLMNQPAERKAEIRALQAERLSAFSALKLQHIKDGVAALLAMIGRNGLFDEYTVHDISHINAMLTLVIG